MVFSSLLFVFAFFALNMLIYHLAPTIRAKNAVMLVFSLVFYAWAGPAYLALLLSMTFVDYRAALIMENSRTVGARKAGLILGCGFNLLLLGIFKYLTFFLENINLLFPFTDSVPQILLPIGISFYTFQLLSYVVDVYRGDVAAQKKFTTLLLYVSLFHQCIAGPIVRYETVAKELTNRSVTAEDRAYGIRRFCMGLLKKAVFANRCGMLADTFLVAVSAPQGETILMSRPALSIILGTLCYTLQIYLDFSAYSDMAIGMGRIIGFHYLENFNYPYIASTVTDFWRRWHISLSSFFRDYVYIPLGGSRCKKHRIIFNLLVVWACTGFWHGASWNYVLWGLYYFLLLALEKFVCPNFFKKLPRALSHVYVLLVVNFGWMLFRSEELSWLGAQIRGIFCLNGNAFSDYETMTTLKANVFFLLAAILACTPIVKYLGEKLRDWGERSATVTTLTSLADSLFPVFTVILAAAVLVGESYNPFLYFRF